MVIQKGGDLGMAFAQPVQQTSVLVRQARENEINSSLRPLDVIRLLENCSGARRRRCHQAVPIRQDLVVEEGANAFFPHCEQLDATAGCAGCESFRDSAGCQSDIPSCHTSVWGLIVPSAMRP